MFEFFSNKVEIKDLTKKRIDLSDGAWSGLTGILGSSNRNDNFLKTNPTERRSEIYNSVDFIDKYDESVSKHLSDIAEDATQYSLQTKSPIWITSKDKKLQELITNFLNEIDIHTKCSLIVRDLAKYGDKFGRVIIDPKKGITGLILKYHPKNVVRLENKGELVGFHLRDEDAPLQSYEMIHWKTSEEYIQDDILENDFKELFERYYIDKDPIYGKSSIYRVISVAKRLKFAEDALLLGRIVKSKVYRNHYIEVGTGSINDRIRIMKEYIRNWRKNSSIDTVDGDMYSEKNFFSYEEDVYHPVQSGKGSSDIQQIGGDLDVAHIEDLEYFKKKRNIILGYPAEEDYMTNRLQEDSKYAKMVSSFQKYLLRGLYELIDIHLDILGKYSEERKYTINLLEVDSYTETERNEMLSSSADFVEQILNLTEMISQNVDNDENTMIRVDKEYLYKYLFQNYLRLPDMDYDKLIKKVEQEEIHEPPTSQPEQKTEQGDKEESFSVVEQEKRIKSKTTYNNGKDTITEKNNE